jgi:hypothetical protein
MVGIQGGAGGLRTGAGLGGKSFGGGTPAGNASQHAN